MAMLVAAGVLSVGWMAVIAVLVTARKLLPPRAALDVLLALGIAGSGVLILVDPRRSRADAAGVRSPRRRRPIPDHAGDRKEMAP
jgi:hypothetical protein